MILRLASSEEAGIHTVQGRRAHLIHRCYGQTGLAEFQQRRLQLLVAGDHAAHPGAAGREPLGHGVHNDQVFIDIPEPGHGGYAELIVVAELPVHLVADQEQIVLLGNVRDHPHFRFAQHHAGGVAGVGDEDGPGVGSDQALDAVPVGVAVALPGIGGQGTDDAAGGVDEGGVVGVVRLGDDDLGVGGQNGQASEKQGLTTTGGHQDIVILQRNTQGTVILLDCLDQAGPTGRCLVGKGMIGKLVDCLVESLGSRQVGLTDVQMVDLLSVLLRLHGKGMEFPHGGRLATIGVNGNLHVCYLHRLLPKAPDFYILS